jgi:hypothetical protein
VQAITKETPGAGFCYTANGRMDQHVWNQAYFEHCVKALGTISAARGGPRKAGECTFFFHDSTDCHIWQTETLSAMQKANNIGAVQFAHNSTKVNAGLDIVCPTVGTTRCGTR